MKNHKLHAVSTILLISSLLLAFTGLFFYSFDKYPNISTQNSNRDLDESLSSSVGEFSFSSENLESSFPKTADGDEEDEGSEDEDEDGIDDDLESLNTRDIEVENSTKEFQISSELRQGERQDHLQIELHLEDNGVELAMEYASETEGEEGVEIKFDLEITRLIEYSDNDANLRFSPDNDSIIDEYMFNSFKDIEYIETPITESSSLHEFILQTTDNNVTFHFYIAEEFVDVNGASLAPQQMKFDITIDHYNFSSPSSSLALDVKMLSDLNYELEDETEDEEEGYDHDEEWLITADSDMKGFFSWKEFAIVDGVNQSIGTWFSPKDGENPGAVYLSYPRGDIIFHDPELGVAGIIIKPETPQPPNGGDSGLPIWAIILIVLSSILVLFFGLMSKQEYRDFLLNRVSDYSTGPHRLTMEDVLDNKIRNRIISIVMDDPGVHYSEVERQVDTSSSNLAWHLDILETYQIISKKRVGRYLIFYPYVEKNPFADLDVSIVKSKTTLDIFQLIADNPGINQSHLSKRMDLNRKTVKYHLDKLIGANMVEQKKEGTKMSYRSLP